MKTCMLLLMVLAVCAGSVRGLTRLERFVGPLLERDLDLWDDGFPGRGPIRPIDPIGPIRPFPPIKPWWPLRGCRAESGGWEYESLPQNKWPRSSSRVFYLGCKIWRPTWSSCTGTCKSSHNITTNGTRSSQKTECECCKSAGIRRVRPYPRCWVIKINNGAFLSGKFETVRQRVDYTYSMTARCGCRTCSRGIPHIWRGSSVQEVTEDDVTELPEPPRPSSAERDSDLRIAARTNTALRGVLSRGSLEF